MKKLKKRLPALLLALMIAVMPLMMAVPVSAAGNVLEGVSSSGEPLMAFPLKSGEVLYLPILTYNGVSVFDSSSIFVFYYDGGDRLQVSYYPGMTLSYFFINSGQIRCNWSNPNSGNIKYYGTYYNFSTSSWGSWGGQSSTSSPITYGSSDIDLWVWPTSYAVDSGLGDPVPFSPSIYLYTPSYGGPGVLSVFSGVSSWLAGAVNNMVSMFWTAEGGLSVLGVLAVASLAIAFIILLIYLLAGWMKFK